MNEWKMKAFDPFLICPFSSRRSFWHIVIQDHLGSGGEIPVGYGALACEVCTVLFWCVEVTVNGKMRDESHLHSGKLT